MQADVPVSSYEHPLIWCLRGGAVILEELFVEGAGFLVQALGAVYALCTCCVQNGPLTAHGHGQVLKFPFEVGACDSCLQGGSIPRIWWLHHTCMQRPRSADAVQRRSHGASKVGVRCLIEAQLVLSDVQRCRVGAPLWMVVGIGRWLSMYQ